MADGRFRPADEVRRAASKRHGRRGAGAATATAHSIGAWRRPRICDAPAKRGESAITPFAVQRPRPLRVTTTPGRFRRARLKSSIMGAKASPSPSLTRPASHRRGVTRCPLPRARLRRLLGRGIRVRVVDRPSREETRAPPVPIVLASVRSQGAAPPSVLLTVSLRLASDRAKGPA